MLPAIESHGARLVAISPQGAAESQKMIDKHGLGFDILVDRGNEVASAFGLKHGLPDDLKAIYGGFKIDLGQANADGEWTLPMPARFVIDRAGIVRAADADPDYTRRPEPSETVAVLAALP